MQPAAVLTITMTTDGQYQVSGPIDNKPLCYAMLGMARDMIQVYESKPKVQAAPAGIDLSRLNGR